MTLGRGRRAASVSDVRPFPARVVRPEWARAAGHRAGRAARGHRDAPPVGAGRPCGVRRVGARALRLPAGAGRLVYTGVVCEVAVRAFVDGQVRGHEAVQAQRVESLVRHHATTDAPPALVALLHHAGPAYARTLDEVCATPPILDFAGPSGLQQPVWRVPGGPATARLADELTAADHYIADGHHRVAAALAAWRLARRARGRRSAVRRAPDGRPPAVRVPPTGDRAGRPRALLDLLAPRNPRTAKPRVHGRAAHSSGRQSSLRSRRCSTLVLVCWVRLHPPRCLFWYTFYTL